MVKLAFLVQKEGMLALEGIKILDLSGLVPGNFCTMILGELGAEILKVEVPEESELVGLVPSPRREERSGEAVYLALNRNKKSICPSKRMLSSKVIGRGVAKRAGIDYDTGLMG